MSIRSLRQWSVFSNPHPTLCSAGDDDGGDDGDTGGGGGDPPKPPPKKTFTQDEVSRIAAKEKREAERAAREKADAEWQAKLAERDAELEELRKKSMSADERAAAERKERDAAEKRSREEHEAKLKEARDKEKKRAELAEERWRNDRRNLALNSALSAAKVLAEAADDAAAVMLGKSKIEVDDEGAITGVIYAGKAYDTLEEAAKQFLQDKPHYAPATGNGGGGTRGSTGGGKGGKGGRPLHELARDQLLARTVEQDRAQGRK